MCVGRRFACPFTYKETICERNCNSWVDVNAGAVTLDVDGFDGDHEYAIRDYMIRYVWFKLFRENGRRIVSPSGVALAEWLHSMGTAILENGPADLLMSWWDQVE